MKKTLTALAFAVIFTACTSKPKTETDTANSAIQADTMSMDQNSFSDVAADINIDGVSDTIIGHDGVQYVKIDPNAPAATVKVDKPAKKATATKSTSTKSTSPTKTTASSGSTGTGVSSTGTGSESSTETAAPEVAKKKGWSNTAKGTVIGAGTGAVAGAIIGKNKVKGAVIGGLIGAGGGFVVGKVLDKKAENKQ